MKKIATKICLEKASENNSFQTEKLYLAGYDLEDLARNSSMTEILFLLYGGELPSHSENKKLLEVLMVLLSLPSPRHVASRAAMNSGICKTNAEHILPISLMAIGGEQLGATEVRNCWEFIENNIDNPPEVVASKILANWIDKEKHIAPGFGQSYGEIDILSTRFFKQLLAIKPSGKTMKWVQKLIVELEKHNVGILDVGLAACVFHELSFGSRESIALYQFLRAPGLMAYGLEQTHNPVSAIPMLEDSQYELTK